MNIVMIEPASLGIHVYAGIKLPRLGLPTIAAILKQRGHDVLIFHEESAPINWYVVTNANLVFLSTITCTAPRAYEIADKIREENISVFIGGPHVTFEPEEALAHTDVVIRGEGEETIEELVNAYAQNYRSPDLENIKGISYSRSGIKRHNQDRPLITDLTKVSFPDLDAIVSWENRITPFQFSRGCPFNCSFCSVTPMFGKSLRFFDTEAMAEEIIRRKPKNIFFYDDNFTADKRKTRALLEIFQRRNFKTSWTSQNRIDVAHDRDLLKLMRDTGNIRQYIGFESINPETLKNFKKGQSVEQISEAIQVIQSYGINIHGMFVVGSDFDTPDTVRETVKFAIKHKLSTIQIIMLIPFPGTEVREEKKKNNSILSSNWKNYDGHYVLVRPKLMSPWQLQAETLRGMLKFFSLSRWWKLTLQFKIESAFYNNYARKVLKKWRDDLNNKEFLKKIKVLYEKKEAD